jgi:hypothetical protein
MRIPKGNPVPASKKADKGPVAADPGTVVAAAPTAARRRPAPQKNGCIHVATSLISVIPIVLFFYYSAFRSDFPVHKTGLVLVHAGDDLNVAAVLSQKLIDRKYHVLLTTDADLNPSTVSFPAGVVPFSLDTDDSSSVDSAVERVRSTIAETQLPFVGFVRSIGTDLPLTPMQLSSLPAIHASFSREVLGSMALINGLMPLLVKHSGRVVLSTTHVGTTGEYAYSAHMLTP